jgi:dihydrofolate reductase
MGKIISLINTTPDGFADAQPAIFDAAYFEFVQELLTDVQTIAFGRHSFEQFQHTWPARLESENTTPWQMKMAHALTDKPKVVFSSTLTTTSWKNSMVVPEIKSEQLNYYKQEDQKGLLTVGSLSVVAALTKMNVIDDYYFCIQPFLNGNGKVRLFDVLKLDQVQPLHYVGSTTLPSGVHIVHYAASQNNT